MSVIDSCIGVDPGPTTGIALLDYCEGKLAGRVILQAEGSTVVHVLNGLLIAYYSRLPQPWVPPVEGRRIGSVEHFVDGQSAGSRGEPARVTRQLEADVVELLLTFGYSVKVRPAADVKPWATDRLLAAALDLKGEDLTDDLQHGWDGARHCVYGAHEAGVIAHPLLRKGKEGSTG